MGQFYREGKMLGCRCPPCRASAPSQQIELHIPRPAKAMTSDQYDA